MERTRCRGSFTSNVRRVLRVTARGSGSDRWAREQPRMFNAVTLTSPDDLDAGILSVRRRACDAAG